jgi:uncharacterized integral membrane protein
MNMKKLPNVLLRIFLLAACAGISLAILMMGCAAIQDPEFFHSWRWTYFGDLSLFFVLGASICLVFGTPFMLMLDKYFSRFRIRYMVGGAIAALIAWLIMEGQSSHTPFLALAPGRWNWPFSIIFMGTGFATGALFTLLLSAFDHCKKRRKRP